MSDKPSGKPKRCTCEQEGRGGICDYFRESRLSEDDCTHCSHRKECHLDR